jgi:hypothetical protein
MVEERITIPSPKTEHHEGMDKRVIPLFPELKEELLRACELAPEGAIYVVNEKYREAANGPNGWRSVNLRTTFKKIVIRAGLEPWPRLFHNLRSSRQTELEERFPTHVVCLWLGNSPDIAREHYLQITDEHWQRAQVTADERENLNKSRNATSKLGGAKSGADYGGPEKNEFIPIHPNTNSGWGGIREFQSILDKSIQRFRLRPQFSHAA